MGTAERKEREKEQRRQDIISAAEKLIFEKGVLTTTIDEVAEQAELSKGTIYLYFKSKEDLIYAIMRKGLNILNEMLQSNISSEMKGYQMLVVMASSFIQFSVEFKDYFNILQYCESKTRNNLEISQEEFKRQVMDDSPLFLVSKCVEIGQKDGSLRSDIPPTILASLLWSQMMGLIMVSNTHKEIYNFYNVSVEELFKTHIEVIGNGCKK